MSMINLKNFNLLQATGSKIGSNMSTIIIGVVAVMFTYVSTLVVDRLGRKILLLYSVVVMGICTFFIGGFFYAKDYNYNVSSIGFIPLVALCIFIILFAIGFGPIPWMMMGEIFPAQIKGKIILAYYSYSMISITRFML